MDASAEKKSIPLFPLRMVLFPGGKLDLQIFEQRYIDLVSASLRSGSGFGICLIKEGEEIIREGTRQTIHRTGTYARIVDWNQLENGLLGITIQGEAKFHVGDCWAKDDGLLMGEVEFTGTDAVNLDAIPLEAEFEALADLLLNLENHPMVERKELRIDYNNLRDVGWRLSELIPVDMEQKQELLELDDPVERIQSIERLVADMANSA